MMITALVCLTVAVAVSAFNATDPASLQLLNFKRNTKGPNVLSLSTGCPVEIKYATSSINTNLLRNDFLLDSLNHLLSERIPERVVHARGVGAFGYFEVTHDVTDLCKAKFLSRIGKKTPIAARFSVIAAERGGNDLVSAARGFAVKFYTEDGNFDIPGLNIPVFILRDPVKFTFATHAFHNNPANDLPDTSQTWDYVTSNPEILLSSLMVFSDLGIPDGYKTIRGYSIHTMQLSNSQNETNFARFYFTPDSGEKYLTSEEASRIRARNEGKDYLGRDLYNSIGRGDFPSWTVYMQPLSMEDVRRALKRGVDVFDVTRYLSEKDYPLRAVGKFTLNKNPKNYFAEIEQLAFCPGNLVPGILGAPDKVFEARSMSYRNAQAYRLGINFNKIPVNRPLKQIYTYNRDGAPPVDNNEGGAPNYYPNIFNGPEPVENNEPSLIQWTEIMTSNLDQATEFYESLSEAERGRLANNLALTLLGVIEPIEEKVIDLLAKVDQNLADRVSIAIQNFTSASGNQ